MGMRLELLVAAFAAGGFLLAGEAVAQDAAVAECATLAQSPFDSETPEGKGVDFDAIDTEAAIAACQAALENEPDDARVMFHLARAYDAAGQYEEARIQYEEAGERGNLLALNGLGSLYENGRGVDIDYDKAVVYYAEAVDGGYVVAMENLGSAYENGRGVTQSYEVAAEFYRQAADLGSAWAAGSLGWLTENGYGVDQDDEEAVRLYQIAADGGEAFAQHNLAWMYSEGRGGLAVDEAKAVELFRKAAKQNWPRSMFSLAWHYSNGVEVERDPAAAEELLRKILAMPDVEQDIRADTLNNLAWLFAVEGIHLEEAESMSRESITLQEDGNHYDTLAWILHLTDRNEDAMPLIEKALASNPDNVEYQEHFDAIKSALK